MKKLMDLFNKKFEIILVFITIIISISNSWFYYIHGMLLYYQDASTHLNIARRVTDNLFPSIVQLGGTWLPLLHILELPFVQSDFLWRSGLAGSIVSGCAFIIGEIFLYKLIFFTTKNKLSSLIGVFIYISNPNLLYLQSTAMFEPLLLCTMLISIFYFTQWLTTGKLSDLLKTAFATFFHTLAKYDAWFVAISLSVFVFIITFIKTKKVNEAESRTIIFSTLALFGIALWLLVDTVIFHNTFYFSSGEFSARSQQVILESKGLLPTSKNLLLSTAVYTIASIANNGIFLTIFIPVGLLILLLQFIKNRNYHFFISLSLLVPFVFNISALTKGSSVIWLPYLPPYISTYFNVRYGLALLPFYAFLTGIIFSTKSKSLKIVVLIMIICQTVYFYSNYSIYKIPNKVVLRDETGAVDKRVHEGAMWFRKNYDNGLILISASVLDSFMIESHVNYKQYIYEGSGYYWTESLNDPSSHAKWVILSIGKPGLVEEKLINRKEWANNYVLKYKNDYYGIYKLNK